MFTLSVVIGSSILYKDFNAASPQRLLKFIFGCISTFIGVYLITSKRPLAPTKHHHRPSIPHFASNPHLRTDLVDDVETAPLLVIIPGSSSGSGSEGLGETPPQFLGTSFGYHFAKTGRGGIGTGTGVAGGGGGARGGINGGASTLPRERRPRDGLASAIWSRWRHATEPVEENGGGGGGGRPDTFGGRRSQSEVSPPEQGEGLWRDTVSEGSGGGGGGGSATRDDRGSWGRNRGYSVV